MRTCFLNRHCAVISLPYLGGEDKYSCPPNFWNPSHCDWLTWRNILNIGRIKSKHCWIFHRPAYLSITIRIANSQFDFSSEFSILASLAAFGTKSTSPQKRRQLDVMLHSLFIPFDSSIKSPFVLSPQRLKCNTPIEDLLGNQNLKRKCLRKAGVHWPGFKHKLKGCWIIEIETGRPLQEPSGI